jgi:hypothetical protein
MTRRAVARAPSAPMVGHPMVGDPFFDDDGPGGLCTRRACQYASAILKKRGLLPPDASHLSAVWFAPKRTVIFYSNGEPVMDYKIPDHIMDYDPERALLS